MSATERDDEDWGDYRTLFEALPNPYLILLPDTPRFTIVAVNDLYASATLTERGTIVGMSLFDVFPDNPDDPTASGTANLLSSLDQVVRSREPDTMAVQKYDVRRPDGQGFEERFWSPLNTPILDADGRVTLIIHRVVDVTELIQLKQKGSEQDDEIFRRAQEIQGMNRDLRASNARLSEMDRVKSAFFSNVSHELRTPLTLILGQVDRLGSGAESSAARDSVRRNAQLLLHQVNDLLDAAKLESNTFSLDYAEVDLANLVSVVVDGFQGVIQRKQQELTVRAPEKLVAECDPVQIERVLLNLLSNAHKFTPDGGLIGVSLTTVAGEAVLTVSDSGPGIAPEWRETVFERFLQVGSALVRSEEGTGLGLAITRDLLALHGGSIQVVDSDQPGAVLEFRLPLVAPAGKTVERDTLFEPLTRDGGFRNYWEQPEAPAAGSVVAGPDESASEGTVLVVDDNAEMAAYVRDVLAESFTVLVAPNAGDGLDLASHRVPNLVVTDLMMPKVSGVDLIAAMRGTPGLEEVPVIVLTAKLDDDLRDDLLMDGANDFLAKPFSPRELRARALNLVRANKAVIALRAAEARLAELGDVAAVAGDGAVPDLSAER